MAGPVEPLVDLRQEALPGPEREGLPDRRAPARRGRPPTRWRTPRPDRRGRGRGPCSPPSGRMTSKGRAALAREAMRETARAGPWRDPDGRGGRGLHPPSRRAGAGPSVCSLRSLPRDAGRATEHPSRPPSPCRDKLRRRTCTSAVQAEAIEGRNHAVPDLAEHGHHGVPGASASSASAPGEPRRNSWAGVGSRSGRPSRTAGGGRPAAGRGGAQPRQGAAEQGRGQAEAGRPRRVPAVLTSTPVVTKSRVVESPPVVEERVVQPSRDRGEPEIELEPVLESPVIEPDPDDESARSRSSSPTR